MISKVRLKIFQIKFHLSLKTHKGLLKSRQLFGAFCYADQPSIADVYLIAQIEGARRFKVDISAWPIIARIEQNCMALEAFQKAAPMQQIDAS